MEAALLPVPRRRVGLALSADDAPRWVESMVGLVRRSDLAEVVIAARVPAPPARRGGRMFRLYERADRRLTAGEGPDALERVALDRVLDGLARGGLADLAAAGLDVVLWAGSGHPPAALRGIASEGVWWIRDGDAPYFWDLLEGADEIVTELVASWPRSDPDSTRVLYRASSGRYPASLQRTRNPIYWKAAHYPKRALEGAGTSAATTTVARPLPGTRDVVRFATRLARGRLARASGPTRWHLAVNAPGAKPSLLDGGSGTLTIEPPPGRDFADPFLFERAGRRYVFFEDQRPGRPHADISYVELLPDGGHTDPTVVLELDHHLSYPFVFESDGEAYMLPEMSAAGRVELYRAERFPDRWVPHAVLIPGVEALDATIVRHRGLFWMFATVVVPGGPSSEELSVFYAHSLTGPWLPHPRNPVVTDASRARPAGRILHRDGALIRPGQDCSHDYGAGIVLSRIDVLTPTEYRETPIRHVAPRRDQGELRTHCYDAVGGYEVIDRFARTD